MPRWQLALVGKLNSNSARTELGFRHVRFHSILDDDMGTLDNEITLCVLMDRRSA